MVSCGVTKKSRYGVESYDYTIKYRLDDNYDAKKVFTNAKHNDLNDQSNKRRHGDRYEVKLRLGKRVNSNQPSEERQQPRVLDDLITTADDPAEDIAKDIAGKLSEEKVDLIGKLTYCMF